MIVQFKDLATLRQRHQRQKIILTSGTFDLFHIGHLRYLEAVKGYGEVLIVMLSGDARASARKGPSRPVIPENERAEILDALRVVDYVFVDPSKRPPDSIDPIHADIINALQPDCYVTDGLDPRLSNLLDEYRLIILPRVDAEKYTSTSAIIDHIKSLPD